MTDLTGKYGIGGKCLFELFCKGLDSSGELLVGTGEQSYTFAVVGCR